jgi:uncharacterized oligopeptide transporter (OPT) family protein
MLPAPQSKLMATLAAGVMQGDLPWRLLALGAGIALAAELFGIASLPFAIGLYLPITTSAPLILGGLAAWLLDRGTGVRERREQLTLVASGLVAGDALMGIGVAALVVSGLSERFALRTPGAGGLEDLATILPFILLFTGFAAYGRTYKLAH